MGFSWLRTQKGSCRWATRHQLFCRDSAVQHPDCHFTIHFWNFGSTALKFSGYWCHYSFSRFLLRGSPPQTVYPSKSFWGAIRPAHFWSSVHPQQSKFLIRHPWEMSKPKPSPILQCITMQLLPLQSLSYRKCKSKSGTLALEIGPMPVWLHCHGWLYIKSKFVNNFFTNVRCWNLAGIWTQFP